MYYQKLIYIFFNSSFKYIFFSTNKVNAKAFLIDDIEISEKLENNFNKEILVNKGFRTAFDNLMSKLIKSKDLDKVKKIPLNEIKSMIDTFSIKEEKFVNQTYELSLGVSFNKKEIYSFLNTRIFFHHRLSRKNFYLFL